MTDMGRRICEDMPCHRREGVVGTLCRRDAL